MYITYDKFYQVPRMWLVGYDEDQRTLSREQVGVEDAVIEIVQLNNTITQAVQLHK